MLKYAQSLLFYNWLHDNFYQQSWRRVKVFIGVIKPEADSCIPEFHDFNLMQFNLIKMKFEQNALLNIGNILEEKIILTKFI